jgi:GT2 family glycosyltransferase
MKNSDPVVSVIVVTWNAMRYVEECLESLQRDHELSIEIIVVDNASTDQTPQLIAQKFPQVMLIRNQENLGFAKGNNIGIAHSRGKYLFLINSDVNVPSGCIGKLLSFVEANPRVGVAGPQMLGPTGSVRRSTMRFPTIWNSLCRALALDSLFRGRRWAGGYLMSDFDHKHTREVEVLNGWFWVVRRKALDEVGLLDERFFMYGEDIDWCFRFHKAGWKLMFCADASAIHYGGASSAAAPVRFYIEMQKASFQYWGKHHGWPSSTTYRAVVLVHELVRLGGYGVAYLLKLDRNGVEKMERSWAVLSWITSRESGRSWHVARSSRPQATVS